MKIRLLRNTICDGQAVSAGDVVEASEQAARVLISMRKAEPYTAPLPAVAVPPAPDPEQAVIQAPEAAVAKPVRSRRVPKGGQTT